jgi:uncharacterized protein YuzE
MYLTLDGAAVERRVAITEEEDPTAAGITLDFDAAGRLVGLALGGRHAERPAPQPVRTTYDPIAGLAYLYLAKISPGGVADTVAFGSEETRPAWGINLDFGDDGRLLGVEFESAKMAPQALLDRAERPGG